MKDWHYVDKSEGGLSYYHNIIQGYKVEVHDVNNGIEIGIYSREGNLLKPPYRIEAPFEAFTTRHNQIIIIIKDLINSL